MAEIKQAYSENRRLFISAQSNSQYLGAPSQNIENLISDNHFTTIEDTTRESNIQKKPHGALNQTSHFADTQIEPENIQYFVRENANSINIDDNINLMSESDIHNVYQFSLSKLRALYKDHFLGSEECKELILELNNSIIEFRFL